MGCIYMARNKVNGKCYIGQTSHRMQDRKWVHQACVKRGSRGPFHVAMRKYGFDAFAWKVLFHDVDKEDLWPVEQKLIQLKKTLVPNGYNLVDRQQKSGYKLSEEHKEKISKALMGHFVSQDAREKMRKRRKGKPSPVSKEGLKRISSATKACWQDPMHRAMRSAAISKARKGCRCNCPIDPFTGKFTKNPCKIRFGLLD